MASSLGALVTNSASTCISSRSRWPPGQRRPRLWTLWHSIGRHSEPLRCETPLRSLVKSSPLCSPRPSIHASASQQEKDSLTNKVAGDDAQVESETSPSGSSDGEPKADLEKELRVSRGVEEPQVTGVLPSEEEGKKAREEGSDNQGQGDATGPVQPATILRELRKEKKKRQDLEAELKEVKRLRDSPGDGRRLSERQQAYLSGAPVKGLPLPPPEEEEFAFLPAVTRAAPLDLAKLRSCFSFTTFFATSTVRYGSGGMFMGNLRGPTEEVRVELQKKMSEAVGKEVEVFFLTDELDRQCCIVQPTDEFEYKLEAAKVRGALRWPLAIFLGVTSVFTTVFLAGVNLDPSRSLPDLLDHAIPLVGGLSAVLGLSEVAMRVTANHYNVELGPPYLIPSGWLGCLGIDTRIETVVPTRTALFDIAASRAITGWAVSFSLAVAAFLWDGGVNGGSNPIYVEPRFFEPNILLSFIQYVIGPYSDELGNVLPHAVTGLGVPVNPLAFAGLLGIVITSLNLMPTGRLEGGRIVQALFGRKRAKIVSVVTNCALGLGGLLGSILCLGWGFIVLFLRGGEELPAQDEVTPVSIGRYMLGWFLLGWCILSLLPNSSGTFPSTFFTPSYFITGFEQ